MNTDFLKLQACYSLIGQTRVRHNIVLNQALQDWTTFEPYWKNYARRPRKFGGDLFGPVLLPLLEERNGLRNNIWAGEGYTDAIWASLSEEEVTSELLRLMGNRRELEQEPTKATYSGLNYLLNIDISDVDDILFPDPTEDFTTYTEVDPGSDVSITSDQITCVGFMTRDTDTYVYKDYGASYFDDIDWTTFAFYDSDSAANYDSMGFIGGSNDIDDLNNMPTTAMSCGFYNDTSNLIVNLRRGGSRRDNYNATVDTEYNFRVERTAGPSETITCKIYTGETLQDTLTETSATWAVAWRYVWALNSYNSATANRNFDGYIKDMDIGEAAAGPTGVKTINTTAIASVKTINTTAIASVKTLNNAS